MIKVGLIGSGYWGKNLLRNFYQLPTCDLKIVIDKNKNLTEKFQKIYPGVKFSTEEEDLFQEDIDAVAIATPAITHYSLAKKTLQQGLHTFIEKPMTLLTKEAEELTKIAESKKLTLMVGHLLLYHPAVRKMKEIIKSGDIGEILYIYSSRLNLGKVRKDENVVWSLAPHDISIILYLIEESPDEVVYRGKSFLQENIDDVGFIILNFPSGKIAHIHVSWLDPHKIRKTIIVGSKKMMVFDDTEPYEKLKIYDKGVDIQEFPDYPLNFSIRFGDIYIPKLDSVEPLKKEIAHFIESIEKKQKPLTDGQNGIEVVKVLEKTGGLNV